MKILFTLLICAASVFCQVAELRSKGNRQGFTAITTAVYTLPDGTTDPKMPVGQIKQLKARSSSGKTVEAMTIRDFLSKPGFHWRHIYDPSSGVEITAVDPLRSRETLHKDKAAVREEQQGLTTQAQLHCQIAGLKFLAYEYLFGVRLAHLIGENKVEIQEAWAWEEEDCFIAQSRHDWKNPDGTIRSTTFDRLDSLVIGEPDGSLFEVPQSYTEKSMQQVEKDMTSRSGAA